MNKTIKEQIEEIRKIQKNTNIVILKEWEMERLKNEPNVNKIIYQIQDKIMELKSQICGTTIVPGGIFKKGWLYIPKDKVQRIFSWMRPYKDGFVIKIIDY